MNEPCPVCGSGDIELQGNYRYHHPTFAGLKRANCGCCGMVFASPMPMKSALDAYNGSYFETAHGGKPNDKATIAFFSGIARLRLDHLERYLRSRNIRPESVIEIGPGRGFSARTWLEKYPGTRYWAFEPDTSCHGDLLSYGVRLINLPGETEGQINADVLVMSNVLEHVPEPLDYLAELTGQLREGGVIFIEVPCRDWQHKPIDEPHLLFFDKTSLLKLLQNIGFDNIVLSYHGEEIEQLKSASYLRKTWLALRGRLIASGLIAPFSRTRSGMAALGDPLERAMVSPFKAHCESSEPAWWLRAFATKEVVS